MRRIAVVSERLDDWVIRVEEDIDAELERMPEYEKLLAMYRDSLIAQGRAKDKIAPVDVDMDKGQAAVCASTGLSLLGESGAKLKTGLAVKLFNDLKTVVSKHGKDYAEEMERIDEKVEAGDLDVAAVLEEVFAGGSAEDLKKKVMDLDLDGHVFASLVFASIRPNLELYSEALRPLVKDDDWERKFCPVCGRLPYISKLVDKEGVRMVCCPACSTEWRFPRIKCINCGTTDHEKLRMLYPEDEPRDRYADVCDNCRRYLKAIDTRELARSPIMQIADAATLHIDMLAQREGFVTL